MSVYWHQNGWRYDFRRNNKRYRQCGFKTKNLALVAQEQRKKELPKKCSFCNELKPPREFKKDKIVCNYCYPVYLDLQGKANCGCKERVKSYKPMDDGYKRYLSRLLKYAMHRARRKGVNFDIDRKSLFRCWKGQKGRCALSGMPMTLKRGYGKVHTNASIDRIDSSNGYTDDNIQLICFAVNMMKQDLSVGELKSYCRKILRLTP